MSESTVQQMVVDVQDVTSSNVSLSEAKNPTVVKPETKNPSIVKPETTICQPDKACLQGCSFPIKGLITTAIPERGLPATRAIPERGQQPVTIATPECGRRPVTIPECARPRPQRRFYMCSCCSRLYRRENHLSNNREQFNGEPLGIDVCDDMDVNY
jgi:hypothetical protein